MHTDEEHIENCGVLKDVPHTQNIEQAVLASEGTSCEDDGLPTEDGGASDAMTACDTWLPVGPSVEDWLDPAMTTGNPAMAAGNGISSWTSPPHITGFVGIPLKCLTYTSRGLQSISAVPTAGLC